jgi:histidinol-phosphatase (PHP family)
MGARSEEGAHGGTRGFFVIVDYHMHLRNEDEEIDHTVAAVERFYEVAAARGLGEIGFSEHVYYFRQTRSLWNVPYQTERCIYDLDAYCEAVIEAKRRGLAVKLGLEVDYVPGHEEETRELLDPYPWDYLIGSVHFIDGHGIDGPPPLVDAAGPEETWRRYESTLTAAASSGLFDTLAHPDLVKMFGPRLEWAWSELVPALTHVCLEVSSAGIHKPHGRLYPEPELLASARAAGVRITLASDAHVPQDVGRDLGRAIEHARDAGYETVTVFDARRPRQERLG